MSEENKDIKPIENFVHPHDYFEKVMSLQESREDPNVFSENIVSIPDDYQSVYEALSETYDRIEELEDMNEKLKQENRRYFENMGANKFSKNPQRGNPDRFMEPDSEEKKLSLKDIFK